MLAFVCTVTLVSVSLILLLVILRVVASTLLCEFVIRTLVSIPLVVRLILGGTLASRFRRAVIVDLLNLVPAVLSRQTSLLLGFYRTGA